MGAVACHQLSFELLQSLGALKLQTSWLPQLYHQGVFLVWIYIPSGFSKAIDGEVDCASH